VKVMYVRMTPYKRKEVITDEELTMNTRNNTDAQQGEAHLTDLLRDEWQLHNRLDSPWSCVSEDCPYLGKPIPRSGCKCFTEARTKHAAKVQEAIK